jgi:AcrR family transcriptional regulator
MPAPSRTSRAAVIAAAGEILEAADLEALTMAAVADRVGVRGPSLYKHVANRSVLIRAVAEQVASDLRDAIERAAGRQRDPRASLRAAVVAYRRYVHAHPNGYGLLFAHLLPDSMPDAALVASVGVPIVRRMEELVGPESALEAARTLVAWAHGFVSMELGGAFRLGGSVESAFAFGVDAVLRGVSEAPD